MYDYYKILNIARDASQDEIKRAYRARAKMVHPDINSSEKAGEVFAIVNEAYEVLMDDRKRSMHDLKLNYADATRAEAARKKHYYGSSTRNDTYTNFHYDWESFQRPFVKEKDDADYFRANPWIYNLFFASGMFLGFIIIIVTGVGTLRVYWPWPFGLIGVAGIILVKEGWKGMMGKKNIMNKLIDLFRK